MLTKDQQARVDKALKAGRFNINDGKGSPNRTKKRSWWLRYKHGSVEATERKMAA